MIRSFRLIGAVAAAVAVLALGGAPVGAGDGRVPLPELAKAQGDACVEPADVMRRNHKDFLKTQRDETMYLGIRSGKYSLTGCIECHAAPDPKAADPAIRSIDAFCETCHAYAAVKVDCWSCHNPRPADQAGQALRELPVGADRDTLLAEMKAHLSEKGASR